MSAELEKKKQVVEEIKQKIKSSKSIVFADYSGINVLQDTALRVSCRKAGVDYKVYKNRLIAKALEELNIKGFENKFEGNTSVAFGYTDEVAAPKTISDTAKTVEKLKVKFGLLNGVFADEKQLNVLATLPSRETLIAQLLGVLTAPISQLARTLDAITQKN
ncbi:MAG: 50S ribosomal protein L10 [Clostridia bacterium]|jgi:large subunit ribosomal protein L10|nr:50S ribosomal protein L10 [Clostridia bacterium]MDD4275958.1 50S ribosomal protein L10 [Clostridia bacterium]